MEHRRPRSRSTSQGRVPESVSQAVQGNLRRVARHGKRGSEQGRTGRAASPTLCLANCYFAHDSSGFSILLPFFDAQSGRSCYPLDRHAGPVARTWWRPFPGRGVASPQAPDPDLESLPETISQSTRVGPDPRWLDGPLGASHSSAPFCHRAEAVDSARPSPSHEQAKVSDAVLTEVPSETR